MDYIFGPVFSSRLGRSLGIDLIAKKVCNFDCVYCECGPTLSQKIDRRLSFVDIHQLGVEMDEFLRRFPHIDFDVLTVTGSGEPTLESHLGEILKMLRQKVSKPIAVLTNSSLISRRDVQDDLAEADIVLPSLDAVDQSVFDYIDRPRRGILISDIIKGLKEFRARFPGTQFWLEIMMVKGMNDSHEQLSKLKDIIAQINPHRVNIVTVSRPPAYEKAEALSDDRLLEIQNYLFAQQKTLKSASHSSFTQGLSCHSVSSGINNHQEVQEGQLLETIYRRPLTFMELLQMSRWDGVKLRERLDLWNAQGKIRSMIYHGQMFFKASRVRPGYDSGDS